MLKLFSQFWLILSLLVAPLPYALADVTMADQGQMKCENADQHAKHDQNVATSTDTQNESCECCDQCSSACSSCIHFSVGLSQFNTASEHPHYSSYPNTQSDTIIGVTSLTEFRPPRKFHA